MNDFKTDINTISDPLAKLLQLRGTEFFWKTNEYPDYNFDKTQTNGLIAQGG